MNKIVSQAKIEEMQTMIAYLQSELDIIKGDCILSDDMDEIKNYLEN